jgi:hypothetical protein
MENKIYFYNIFSGTIHEISDKDTNLLDKNINLILKKLPNTSCTKCFGRYYTGRDANNFIYYPCPCIKKNLDLEISSKNVNI